MIVLSWNVRGLNNGPRQKAGRDLVRNHSPDVLFLQDTKLSIDNMLAMAPKLWKYGECQCVGALGASRGVACFWNPQKIFPLWWMSSRSSISLVTSWYETGECILLSNVYTHVEFLGKQLLWSHLHFVRSLAPYHLWVMAGNFNAIVELSEKRGGIPRLDPSALLFRDSISELNLINVFPSNGRFTWNNRRIGESCVAERLD